MKTTLPHDWRCRPYQVPLWKYLNGGGKRVAIKWHRRSGKDSTALHWTTVASQRRVGVYWHMLPTLRQGRKVIWENVVEDEGGAGHRVLEAWPGWDRPGGEGLVAHVRHDEMKLELYNGSIWYVVGSDNYDAAMGSNPVGVVFSEWALSNPKAWAYIRPILTENDGWAIFIWTPRGHNHASIMYKKVKDNADWFCETLTVDDTGVIPLEKIDKERAEGVAEAHILQEYWCSEDAPLEGAFWADQLIDALRDGRITHVAYDEAAQVDTWWDIGYTDATAIWFVQQVGNEIHLIDYDEASGRTPAQDVAMLHRKRDERGFVYGRHIWPHDGGAKTKASKGRPLCDLYSDLGLAVDVQPRPDVEVAVQKVRQILPRCWFDESACAAGLDALRAFRKQQDDDKSTPDRPYFKPGYVHDWSSHGATAFYTGAMAGGGGRFSGKLDVNTDWVV